MLSFFFFQAEDGIRDHCVTGVQTCALPIYQRLRRASAAAVQAAPRPSGGAARPAKRSKTLDGNEHSRTIAYRRLAEIGRASCRERVEIRGGGGPVKNNEDTGAVSRTGGSRG